MSAGEAPIRTAPRTLRSDLARVKRSFVDAVRPSRLAHRTKLRLATFTTGRRMVVIAIATFVPVVLLSFVLFAALTRTAATSADVRDQVESLVGPVLTTSNEIAEAAVLLDRYFASGAEHDRSAFLAHTQRVDAGFEQLRLADLAPVNLQRIDAAQASWDFVHGTVAEGGFVVPSEPEARTGLLATFNATLVGVRRDLSGVASSATSEIVSLADSTGGTARSMRLILFVGIPAIALLGAYLFAWLVRDLRAAREELVAGAERLRGGDLSVRISEQVHGDLAPVAAAFNAMAERIEAQNAELGTLANHDPLTGVMNRRAFEAELTAELERCLRYGQRAALLILDVDHFKRVNDTFGHPAGDAVLKNVSDEIVAAVRGVDRVARWGGEEFAILLPQAEVPAATRVAQRINMSIAQRTMLVDGQRLNVTVSIGVAVADPESPDLRPARLVGEADRALYAAKESGRNRVVLASA